MKHFSRPLQKPYWKLPYNSRVAINHEILEKLSEDIVVRQDLTLGPFVRPSDAEEPIQRWFRYREGYTAELCRRIFASHETYVIDPFCGFGSTLIAARGAGIPSAGLDVNPLATFVARVKTRTYTTSLLDALRDRISRLSRLRKTSPLACPPQLRILPKLFHPDILNALLVFRAAIDLVVDVDEHEFLLLAWIAILERVSNVYREGNGVKYRNRVRHGNDYSVTPYHEWQAKQFPADKFDFVRKEFLTQTNLMLEEAQLLTNGPQPLVAQQDATASVSVAPKRGASLALFSPPYCNCFNYIKAYKLELWMAGFIQTYPDIRRLTTMGVRSRTETLVDPITDPYPSIIEDLISLMEPSKLWSQHLPDVVRGYFADMQRIVTTLYSALKPKGRCVIVVGNSAYAGILIPSDLLLTHIASTAGFEVEEIVVARHLTTSAQQRKQLEPIKDFMRESVIHLRKVI